MVKGIVAGFIEPEGINTNLQMIKSARADDKNTEKGMLFLF